ncbi:SWR1 complex subunit 2 [Porphyridium purpureum]|uniref:SWR1 complex subunit 2 n=1 Tax=Porphyridium purpureum TaxID=35688 RepID=A0A5J4YWB4_PORPP|nr:SWR1 complex subunit 2 [Porphyridium purpureum]|eukprot:POR0535..scf227_4
MWRVCWDGMVQLKWTNMMRTRELPARSTRGKRVVVQPDDEKDADDEFWAQRAFDEDADDASFDEQRDVSSDAREDVVDSDFDEPEEQPDDRGKGGDDLQENERQIKRAERATAASHRKRALGRAYKEPTHAKPVKSIKKATTALPAASEVATAASVVSPLRSKGALRSSTKLASSISEKERTLKAQEDRKRLEKIRERRNRAEPERILTQAELLEEAKQTAVRNAEDLARLLRVEESRKRVEPVRKVLKLPSMRLYSRSVNEALTSTPELNANLAAQSSKVSDDTTPRARHVVSFVNLPASEEERRELMFPMQLTTARIPVQRPTQCAVTGLRARYRDPRSGLPYANVSAFQQLRANVERDAQLDNL